MEAKCQEMLWREKGLGVWSLTFFLTKRTCYFYCKTTQAGVRGITWGGPFLEPQIGPSYLASYPFQRPLDWKG